MRVVVFIKKREERSKFDLRLIMKELGYNAYDYKLSVYDFFEVLELGNLTVFEDYIIENLKKYFNVYKYKIFDDYSSLKVDIEYWEDEIRLILESERNNKKDDEVICINLDGYKEYKQKTCPLFNDGGNLCKTDCKSTDCLINKTTINEEWKKTRHDCPVALMSDTKPLCITDCDNGECNFHKDKMYIIKKTL